MKIETNGFSSTDGRTLLDNYFWSGGNEFVGCSKGLEVE
jgi:hypothetical protein